MWFHVVDMCVSWASLVTRFCSLGCRQRLCTRNLSVISIGGHAAHRERLRVTCTMPLKLSMRNIVRRTSNYSSKYHRHPVAILCRLSCPKSHGLKAPEAVTTRAATLSTFITRRLDPNFTHDASHYPTNLCRQLNSFQ